MESTPEPPLDEVEPPAVAPVGPEPATADDSGTAPAAPDAPQDQTQPQANATVAAENTPATPEKPQVSSAKQLRELQKQDGFQFQEGVLGELLAMEKYGVIKDGARTAELAAMSMDDLKQQPEYIQLEVRFRMDEKQRPDLMGAEFVMAMAPQVQALKEKYAGSTTKDALQQFEDEEFTKLVAEAVAKKVAAESKDGTQVPAERVEAITREAEAEAKVEAHTRKESFLKTALLMMGEYVVDTISNGLLDSDFSAFLDNFFGQAVSRGNSWSHYKENFADKGIKGEMVTEGEVFDHFKSKRKVVETLFIFFKEMKKHGVAEPENLKDGQDVDQVTPEQLKKLMEQVAKILHDVIAQERAIPLQIMQSAILGTMGKTSESAMIDERVFENLIQIGERPKAFDEFVSKFTDVKKSNVVQFPTQTIDAAAATPKAA